MNKSNYWDDIDERLEQLTTNGFVKLPSIKDWDLKKYFKKISEDMNGKTFAESVDSHKDFLNDFEIDKYLTPKLFSLSKKLFSYKGNYENQYHISRRVEPGNAKEMYRAHFDSHLFTLVIPLKIPESNETNGSVGDLIYIPNARSSPSNEIFNFFGKLFYKRYASKEGIEKLSNKKKLYKDNFNDYKPLLFLGNSTLHTNMPVSSDCTSSRLTLLAHFFDPSPKYSVGGILRLIRKR